MTPLNKDESTITKNRNLQFVKLIGFSKDNLSSDILVQRNNSTDTIIESKQPIDATLDPSIKLI